MSNLGELQRGLLCLVKGRPIEVRLDSYLASVAASRELLLVKEIALWWRAFSLESYCLFTSRLMNRLGGFNAAVDSYFCQHSTSPFIEELSQDFLAWVITQQSSMVATVARFERALLRVKRGDDAAYQVEWDRNPQSLLDAILRGATLPPAEANRSYRTIISAQVPDLVCYELIEDPSGRCENTAGTAPNSTAYRTDIPRAAD